MPCTEQNDKTGKPGEEPDSRPQRLYILLARWMNAHRNELQAWLLERCLYTNTSGAQILEPAMVAAGVVSSKAVWRCKTIPARRIPWCPADVLPVFGFWGVTPHQVGYSLLQRGGLPPLPAPQTPLECLWLAVFRAPDDFWEYLEEVTTRKRFTLRLRIRQREVERGERRLDAIGTARGGRLDGLSQQRLGHLCDIWLPTQSHDGIRQRFGEWQAQRRSRRLVFRIEERRVA